MTYTFDNQIEMIAFFNGMSDSTNYGDLLKTDFDIESPKEATFAQRMYFWRYLVQGQYKGFSGAELLAYAVEGTKKFMKNFPWVIESLKSKDVSQEVVQVEAQKMVVPEVKQEGRGRPRTNFAAAGQIIYNKDYDRYYGYGENFKMIASSNILEKLVEKMRNKYGFINPVLVA